MILSDLQREAHAIAKDHGWWDEERSFGDLIALVHSELSEALEAYRETGSATAGIYEVDEDGEITKPGGVPYELADVVIRVADMAAHWHQPGRRHRLGEDGVRPEPSVPARQVKAL